MASMTVLALSISCDGAQAGVARASPVVVPNSYSNFIAEASQRFGIPASWLRAVMTVESAGNPKAVSPKGALGLMQLMPDTWSALRVQYHLGNDPFDPHDNILGGAAYLRELFDRFGASGFLAAYNAGPKRFEDYLTGLRPLQDETKKYISKLARLLPELPVNDVSVDAHAPPDWRTASLFGSASYPQSLSPEAAAERATDRNVAADRFALAPQSNGLFVPVSAPRR